MALPTKVRIGKSTPGGYAPYVLCKTSFIHSSVVRLIITYCGDHWPQGILGLGEFRGSTGFHLYVCCYQGVGFRGSGVRVSCRIVGVLLCGSLINGHYVATVTHNVVCDGWV